MGIDLRSHNFTARAPGEDGTHTKVQRKERLLL
jgi:hypothetical protein